MSSANVELVRRGWEAALRGDVESVADLLADDVQWHGAEDQRNDWGCRNRTQALRWMGEAIARGAKAEVVDVRDAGEGRVITVIQREQLPGDDHRPEPHAQVISIRDGKIAAMVVYPTLDEALAAAAT